MSRATVAPVQMKATGRSPTLLALGETTATSGWRSLFRIAGVAALTVVALIPVQALVYIVWPPPTDVRGYFSVFERNALLGFLDLDLLLVVDQLLMVLVLLGLYIALRHADPSLMLLGVAAGLVGAVLMIVSREATLSMFSLSQQYAAATSDAERAALEAAGQTLLTVYNGTSFSVGYFLTGLAMLLFSIVMLRSSRFSRLTAVAGVGAGVTGLVPASMGTLGTLVAPPPPAYVAEPVPAYRRARSGGPSRFRHVTALLVLNALYFGAAVLAAGYAFLNPALQSQLTAAAVDAFSPTGGLGPLIQAYLGGELLRAILLTFLVNLMLGSLVVITLPSAVVPFAGVLMGLYRAVLWGLLFAPTPGSTMGPTLWLHMPTILLEGEAYVVAMLGVWLWWRAIIASPGHRWMAWRHGFKLQIRVYALVAVLLAAAAVYESLEVIWLLPRVGAA